MNYPTDYNLVLSINQDLRGCCSSSIKPIPLLWRGGREADGVVLTQFLIIKDEINNCNPSRLNLSGVIMYFQDHPALTGTPPSVGELVGLIFFLVPMLQRGNAERILNSIHTFPGLRLLFE